MQERPGFLIRRLYQIHVALFLEECAPERMTPVQYSVLTALDQMGTIDQATLSRSVALDRTNVADVVARLEGRNLVTRRPSPEDGRKTLVSITNEGCELLDRLEPAAMRAHERTIAALPKHERIQFLKTMEYLVASAEQSNLLNGPGAL
ncbi:MAG TPA: MarR family transcriptional regulator [Bradyrhizobium sp.]|nr:MarR family transcriptional regulator [Bradyrhizobium sp.]